MALPDAFDIVSIAAGDTLVAGRYSAMLQSGSETVSFDLALRRGERVEITTGASIANSGRVLVDTVMTVTGPGGRFSDVDDDGGEFLFSQVSFTARRPGTFTIDIAAFFLGDTGDFRLNIVVDDLGLNGISGTGRPERLVGSRGADRITGNDGDDRMIARGGADIIDGGRGNDVLVGGGGRDVFVFDIGAGMAAGGLDVVRDFRSGSDRLDLGEFGLETLDTTIDGIVDGNDAYSRIVDGTLVINLEAALVQAGLQPFTKIAFALLDVDQLTVADFV